MEDLIKFVLCVSGTIFSFYFFVVGAVLAVMGDLWQGAVFLGIGAVTIVAVICGVEIWEL